MRALSRLGSAVAATALASATILAGAGVAAAEEAPAQPDPVFNSKSSVSVSGKGKSTKVTYDNKSGHDVICLAIAAPADAIGQIFEATKDGSTGDDEGPSELYKEYTSTKYKGKIGFFVGGFEDGKSGDFELYSKDGDFGMFGDMIPDAAITDDSFNPSVISSCFAQGDDSGYSEIEVSPGVGVPAGLGSLDAALTGVGSSGSVARTTGSLGS